MANIFKTTLKKDIIADIANNNTREVRFPITKFWASRFSDEYNLNDKTFTFKTFDSVEFSSPTNKETSGMTYTFDFVRTYIDGEDFVVEFKEYDVEQVEQVEQDIVSEVVVVNEDNVKIFIEPEIEFVTTSVIIENETDIVSELENIDEDSSDICFEDTDYIESLEISNEDVFTFVEQWFEECMILNNFYAENDVFATKGKQIIILSNGRVLGFKKTLPVNNDVEIRFEYDKNEKIYANPFFDFNVFEKEVLETLNRILKNNFVFVWKTQTGIFMDDNGVYFNIKYTTRQKVGFNRRYNVQ